jgi:hypothetical protein
LIRRPRLLRLKLPLNLGRHHPIPIPRPPLRLPTAHAKDRP